MSSVPQFRGEDNGSSPMPSEAPVYRATITDQQVKSLENGPRIILSVQTRERLIDPQNLAAGTEPCSPQQGEVWIQLPLDDSERLRIAIRDLDRLGVSEAASDDVSRLHPNHPEAIILEGKEVFVRCKKIRGYTYWNLFWPREEPKPIAVNDLQQVANSLRERIAALRNKRTEPKNS